MGKFTHNVHVVTFLLSFWQEKRRVEEELYRWGVLRYGWREEPLEGVPGVKVGVASVRIHLCYKYAMRR